MLEAFSLRQKGSKEKNAGDLLKRGFLLVEKKEYKQATIELTLANEKNSEQTVKELKTKFKEYCDIEDFEAIRSIGLVLLKTNESDCELLNTLGNCARRLKDYEQANHFYRLAIKQDNSYSKAFYNLAASLGRIEKYDSDVKNALKQFDNIDDFFLPDYKNGFTQGPGENFEETMARLKLAIKENWKKQSITQGQMILQNDIYNLGLYALSQKRTDIALENFYKLKKRASKIEYLDMLILLANSQNGNDSEEIAKNLLVLLKEKPDDRYLNGNLGLLFKKKANKLQANKYLIICASLLEKSGGFFSRDALIKLANEKFAQDDYTTALSLYNKIIVEIDDADIWQRIGDLHFFQNNNVEATKAFKEALRLEPESSLAIQKLQAIYDRYLKNAEETLNEKKYQQAIVILERALDIQRSPELLEKTAKLYKKIKEFEKADLLLEEWYEACEKQKEKELEHERQGYIKEGIKHVKNKDFTLAINNMEKASRIKLDKDVFMYLAHIYKGLNRTRALQTLLSRWQKINEINEKLNTANREDKSELD